MMAPSSFESTDYLFSDTQYASDYGSFLNGLIVQYLEELKSAPIDSSFVLRAETVAKGNYHSASHHLMTFQLSPTFRKLV
jgi:hypothetical protein